MVKTACIGHSVIGFRATPETKINFVENQFKIKIPGFPFIFFPPVILKLYWRWKSMHYFEYLSRTYRHKNNLKINALRRLAIVGKYNPNDQTVLTPNVQLFLYVNVKILCHYVHTNVNQSNKWWLICFKET